VPDDAVVIDANGGTIIPGLVESHFHASSFHILTLEDRTKSPIMWTTQFASLRNRLHDRPSLLATFPKPRIIWFKSFTLFGTSACVCCCQDPMPGADPLCRGRLRCRHSLASNLPEVVRALWSRPTHIPIAFYSPAR